MNLVFDTSVIIDGLRRKKEAKDLLARFEETEDKLYIPSIVGFELFSGESSARTDQQKKILELLKFFEIIDLNWSISEKAGEIYRRGVKGLQVPDYLVAATAMEIGASVVTLNTKHFSRIPGLSLYTI